MAKPKIVIGTANDGTLQEQFAVRVQRTMQTKGEILGLLDLAAFKLKTEGPDGYIDDKIAQAATGPDPRPILAIGTEADGTAEEKLVVKIRRGAGLVRLVGLIKLSEAQVAIQGPHGFLDGVELAGADLLKKLAAGGTPTVAG